LCLPHDHAQPDCRSKGPSQTVDWHADHHHAQRSFKAPGRDLGMMGALLHVLGDALNNVGVIIAAAVIWFTSSPARFYADPAVGMAISLMILCSAGPLIKHSGEILLQSAPQGVSLSDIKHDLEKARLPVPHPSTSANNQPPQKNRSPTSSQSTNSVRQIPASCPYSLFKTKQTN
jgi:zinc transporter 1